MFSTELWRSWLNIIVLQSHCSGSWGIISLKPLCISWAISKLSDDTSSSETGQYSHKSEADFGSDKLSWHCEEWGEGKAHKNSHVFLKCLPADTWSSTADWPLKLQAAIQGQHWAMVQSVYWTQTSKRSWWPLIYLFIFLEDSSCRNDDQAPKIAFVYRKQQKGDSIKTEVKEWREDMLII